MESSEEQLGARLRENLLSAQAEVARARGRKGGRPKVIDKKKIELAFSLYDEKKHAIEEICEIQGISKSTLYSFLRGRCKV